VTDPTPENLRNIGEHAAEVFPMFTIGPCLLAAADRIEELEAALADMCARPWRGDALAAQYRPLLPAYREDQ